MKKGLFVFLIYCFCTVTMSWSATYYVKTGGNDEAAGTSDATAWATISKVASTATTGDTVYFRADDTWTGTPPLLAATSGVIYDGSTYRSSGARASFEATGEGTGTGLVIIDVSTVTFNGFKVDSKGYAVGGIYVGHGAVVDISTITVNNCEVLNGRTTDVGEDWYYGIIVGAQGGKTTSNVNITNNIVHDSGHEGITLYPSGTTDVVSNVLVRGNEIYNSGLVGVRGHPLDISYNSDNVTVEFNHIHDNTEPAITYLTASSSRSPDSTIIRYNLVADNGGAFQLSLASAALGDLSFYGNILINNGIFLSGALNDRPFLFYNNTIYIPDVGQSIPGGFGVYETSTGTGGIAFKNNIIYCGTALCTYDYDSLLTASQHTNNLYYGSGRLVWTSATGYVAADIATWEPTAQNTDPTFTAGTLPTGFSGTYGTDMVPNTTYFAITSGNALLNGAVLGSPYNAPINQAGLATVLKRPAGGGWDQGAYQNGFDALYNSIGVGVGGTTKVGTGALLVIN